MSKGVSGLKEAAWIKSLCSNRVVEKTKVEDKKVNMAFVDLEKAYDNVSRNKLWKVLEEYEVRGKLLRAIQALYDSGMACVIVGVCILDAFKVCKEVKQGCTLSPWLLNVLIDKVVWKTKEILKVGKCPLGCSFLQMT